MESRVRSTIALLRAGRINDTLSLWNPNPLTTGASWEELLGCYLVNLLAFPANLDGLENALPLLPSTLLKAPKHTHSRLHNTLATFFRLKGAWKSAQEQIDAALEALPVELPSTDSQVDPKTSSIALLTSFSPSIIRQDIAVNQSLLHGDLGYWSKALDASLGPAERGVALLLAEARARRHLDPTDSALSSTLESARKLLPEESRLERSLLSLTLQLETAALALANNHSSALEASSVAQSMGASLPPGHWAKSQSAIYVARSHAATGKLSEALAVTHAARTALEGSVDSLKLLGSSLTFARLVADTATFLSAAGRPPEAYSAIQIAIKVTRNILPENHSFNASLRLIGARIALSEGANARAAVAAALKAVKAVEDAHDELHDRDTRLAIVRELGGMAWLDIALAYGGDFSGDDAKKALAAALTLFKSALSTAPDPSPIRASIMCQIASLCGMSQDYKNAEVYYDRSLTAIADLPNGANREEYAQALVGKAGVLMMQDKAADAIDVLKSALGIFAVVLGTGHESFASTILALGRAQASAGQHEEARALIESYRKDHPEAFD